jgi:hypothetical protein
MDIMARIKLIMVCNHIILSSIPILSTLHNPERHGTTQDQAGFQPAKTYH